MSGKRCPVGGVDRSGKIDKISLQNAVETPFWMAVWATEPERLIDVRMSYSDLKIICDLIDSERKKRKVNRMRLIDANKINFEEAFVGVSDFAKDIRSAAEELIKRQQTAFDKGKVIEKLEDLKDIPHDDSVEENISTKIWNKAIQKAIAIVEKGGIE